MIEEAYKLFKEIAELIGLENETVNLISFYFVVLLIISFLIRLLYVIIKKIVWYFQKRKLNRDLHPYFTNNDVVNATKYYIPTKYQNVSPAEDEEPSRRYIASAKNDLLPLFLKKVFPIGKTDNKYFLILADSGMGKTTFLINLYIKQKNKKRLLFNIKPYDIKLVPIWHTTAIEFISKINAKENTILLLDAFDENIRAQKEYEKVLQEIINATANFRIVVITCRTQFFPSQKEEPHETGYFTAGETGELKFQKLYLSVFDNGDVKNYLKKRFNRIVERKKYLKARRIVAKCPNLVIRPMLLNHINDILPQTKKFIYSFHVYEELINSWIRREAKKVGIKEKYGSELRFIRILIRFSENLALNLYNNKEERGGLYIPRGYEFKEGLLSITDFDNSNDEIELDYSDGKSKSLLTRNAEGEYKFSHKSILEFFLAKSIYNRHILFEEFDFSGMSMVRNFHSEMVLDKLQKEQNCQYSINENDIEWKGSSMTLLEFKSLQRVRELYIETITGIRPIDISIFKNLKTLIIFDKEEMGVLYKLYYCFQIHFQKVKDSVELQQKPKNMRVIFSVIFEYLDQHDFKRTKGYIESLNSERLKILFQKLNIKNGLDKYAEDNREHIYDEDHLKKELFSKKELEKIEKLIKEIDLYRQAAPNCNIYF